MKDIHKRIVDACYSQWESLGDEPIDWGKDVYEGWEIAYDSQPTDEPEWSRMARTIVLDTNLDSYFVTVVAKFSSWSGEPTIEGLAYKGDDDPNFEVIPLERFSWLPKPYADHRDQETKPR